MNNSKVDYLVRELLELRFPLAKRLLDDLRNKLTPPHFTLVQYASRIAFGRMHQVPSSLSHLVPYVRNVVFKAWAIDDEQIEGLKDLGVSEDQIFEVTVAAAVGAAAGQLDRALSLLHVTVLRRKTTS